MKFAQQMQDENAMLQIERFFSIPTNREERGMYRENVCEKMRRRILLGPKRCTGASFWAQKDAQAHPLLENKNNVLFRKVFLFKISTFV